MLGNKQPHNSLIYILPVHYDESNSVRIRVPRPMRSARVSRSGCGKGGAILRPVSGQPPIDSPPPDTTSRRRFNSRTKKAPDGRHRSYNSRVCIGSTFRITHEPAVDSANPAPLGGSWNQFQFRGQRGVVDSSLWADSIVPLAHAVVVLTPAGPCYQGNPGDPPVTRTYSRTAGTRKFPRWRVVAGKVSQIYVIRWFTHSVHKILEYTEKNRSHKSWDFQWRHKSKTLW